MNRKLFFLVSVVIIVVAIVLFFLYKPKTNPTSVSTFTPILHGTPTSNGQLEYSESAPGYSIDVLYPSTTGLEVKADVKARTTLEQGLADLLKGFKDDLANMLTPEELARLAQDDRSYEYDLAYQAYRGQATVSYVFTIYEDTGGAHPNSFFKTFVFANDGAELKLADLFTPGSNYLTRLSSLAYDGVVAQLKQKLDGAEVVDSDLDTIHDGTKPDTTSFQSFYIDGTNLHLLFPPYQVAAYAAGVFDVEIPLSKLQDILKK
ncbi:MAG TPA: DUF3298 domain-containing protein [Candidatus Paceibacterota bacterium]|nr:DUF3298 domain-containing protein [Candidatus Paceibacterota bacterium]